MTPDHNPTRDEAFDEWELEAAAYHLASLNGERDSMPALLTSRLNESAEQFIRNTTPSVTPKSALMPATIVWSGWAVAAGLLLVVLLKLWPAAIPNRDVARAKSLTEIRRELVEAKATRYSSDVAVNQPMGDVVWHGPTQQGVMRLRGLPPNDPKTKQYQLWIVDPTRPHPEPVDGGVFNVESDGTALVSVKAALSIGQPKLFAVTEEPAGGVVVSEKGKKGEFVVVMGLPL